MSQVITTKKKTIADISYILIIRMFYEKENLTNGFFSKKKKESKAFPRVANARTIFRLIVKYFSSMSIIEILLQLILIILFNYN